MVTVDGDNRKLPKIEFEESQGIMVRCFIQGSIIPWDFSNSIYAIIGANYKKLVKMVNGRRFVDISKQCYQIFTTGPLSFTRRKCKYKNLIWSFTFYENL